MALMAMQGKLLVMHEHDCMLCRYRQLVVGASEARA